MNAHVGNVIGQDGSAVACVGVRYRPGERERARVALDLVSSSDVIAPYDWNDKKKRSGFLVAQLAGDVGMHDIEVAFGEVSVTPDMPADQLLRRVGRDALLPDVQAALGIRSEESQSEEAA